MANVRTVAAHQRANLLMRSRMVLASTLLASAESHLPVLLVQSANTSPRFINAAEAAWSASVGEGSFACCTLAHTPLNGMKVECEKLHTRRKLSKMISSRIRSLQLASHPTTTRRWRWLVCTKSHLLRKLPAEASSADSALATTSADSALALTSPEEAVAAFKAELKWSEASEAEAWKTGVTLLHFAVLCARAPRLLPRVALHHAAPQPRSASAMRNYPLVRPCPLLAGAVSSWSKGCSPLQRASSCCIAGVRSTIRSARCAVGAAPSILP